MIKENYADMHSKRKKFERSTNVYNLPLPWRPGWRNLISGRAMGGNRFPDESYAAYIRRVLMQVPYYVPPVVIANLVRKYKRITGIMLLNPKVRLPFISLADILGN